MLTEMVSIIKKKCCLSFVCKKVAPLKNIARFAHARRSLWPTGIEVKSCADLPRIKPRCMIDRASAQPSFTPHLTFIALATMRTMFSSSPIKYSRYIWPNVGRSDWLVPKVNHSQAWYAFKAMQYLGRMALESR